MLCLTCLFPTIANATLIENDLLDKDDGKVALDKVKRTIHNAFPDKSFKP
jgi:hypothetical protein